MLQRKVMLLTRKLVMDCEGKNTQILPTSCLLILMFVATELMRRFVPTFFRKLIVSHRAVSHWVKFPDCDLVMSERGGQENEI